MNNQFALPGLLLFLLGGLIGAAGHSLLADESRPPQLGARSIEAARTKPADPNELAESLRGLADVLSSLRGSLELLAIDRVTAAPMKNTRSELTPAAPSDPSLAQAIQQLSSAIAGMPSRGGSAASTSANMLAHSNWVNRREAFASDNLHAAYNSNDEDTWDRAQAEQLQKHMFWNYQDMLDAYGRPDGIETDGNNVEWLYNVTIRDGLREDYYFNFHDGLLVNASYDYEEL